MIAATTPVTDGIGSSLVAVGGGLILVGLAMLWGSALRVRRPGSRRPRLPIGPAGALMCTVLAGAVITCAQWAIVNGNWPAAMQAVVLGLPALLAGATVARLLAVVYVVHSRRHHVRTALRAERRNGR